MTTTTAIQRPDTHDMIVVHRVFRRESDLMPTLIRAVPDGDTARAGVLAQAFSDYQLGLHLHHTGEDELVWPLLLRPSGFRPGAIREGPAGPGSRASTAGAGRPSHGGGAPSPPRQRSRRAPT
jgi:hypothetical protein